MSSYILPLSLWLYVLLPIYMGHRGWPIRAALGMIFAALLPWAVWLIERESLGFGAAMVLFMTFLMLFFALLPLAYGVVRRTRLERDS